MRVLLCAFILLSVAWTPFPVSSRVDVAKWSRHHVVPTATATETLTEVPTSTSTPTTTPTAVSGGLPGNPPDTSADVHLGMPATDKVSSCCGALLTASPPVLDVWGWNNGSELAYPSIYKGKYLARDREVYNTSVYPQSEPLSWFQANHPDWIEYRCDHTSVAYEFGDSSYIPLDVANPAVMSWMEQTIWGPVAATGKYQHLDFDNWQMQNAYSNSGMRCGHFSTPSVWVQQYNGTGDDPNYRTDEIAEAKAIRAWMRANYPTLAFEGNLSWGDEFRTDEATLLSYFDIWFDEQGYTHGNNPGTTWQYTDQIWLDKVHDTAAFLALGDKGWQDNNQEPVLGASTTSAQRQWAIANYLLLKNADSWVWICGQQQYGTLIDLPEYAAAQVGTPTDTEYAAQGVYRRDFTNGLALVNPSSTTSVTVSIASSTYKNLYGALQGSTVTLGPGSGLVLVHA